MKLLAKQIIIAVGDKKICQQINLTFQPGEMWGILGPNGSGKTSLLHTLAGLRPLSAGAIWLDEDPLLLLPPKSIAKCLAILFQETAAIFPQTVWDYCLTARFPHLPYFKKETEQDKKIVENALETVDLSALKKQAITKLSGGEKRRLAIAAVLAQTPEIYLLDEPINHLDVYHQLKVLKHFRQLVTTQQKTVILSLHDMNLAHQFCNRILLLFNHGETLAGLPENILTSENLSRLYQHSIKKISSENVSLWWPAEN